MDLAQTKGGGALSNSRSRCIGTSLAARLTPFFGTWFCLCNILLIICDGVLFPLSLLGVSSELVFFLFEDHDYISQKTEMRTVNYLVPFL